MKSGYNAFVIYTTKKMCNKNLSSISIPIVCEDDPSQAAAIKSYIAKQWPFWHIFLGIYVHRSNKEKRSNRTQFSIYKQTHTRLRSYMRRCESFLCMKIYPRVVRAPFTRVEAYFRVVVIIFDFS